MQTFSPETYSQLEEEKCLLGLTTAGVDNSVYYKTQANISFSIFTPRYLTNYKTMKKTQLALIDSKNFELHVNEVRKRWNKKEGGSNI